MDRSVRLLTVFCAVVLSCCQPYFLLWDMDSWLTYWSSLV